MIKNKKHINPLDYIKQYRRGGLVSLFQDGSETEMSPGTYNPNQNIYIANWDTDPNVQLDENYDLDGDGKLTDQEVWDSNKDGVQQKYNSFEEYQQAANEWRNKKTDNQNITDDNIILDEGELQCKKCEDGNPVNVTPVDGACPEGSIKDDGTTNPCDVEQVEEQGVEDTNITTKKMGPPGWHTPDPYDIGPYGEPGDLFHLAGTIHGMGTDLGLWNPGFRGDDTTTTTTVPGTTEEPTDQTEKEVVCHKCDNGFPISVGIAQDGKCPEGSVPDDGTNPCTGEKETTEETTEETTTETKTFDEAFAEARAAGLETFEWNGKSYNTKLKEEVEENTLDEDQIGMLKEGIQPLQSQSEIDIQNQRNRILSGEDDWWNDQPGFPRQQYDIKYHDADGDGIPDSIDKANEYIWRQMYGGSTPYLQSGGTTSQAEYEQEQREKQAANMADTLQFQGPNTNYLAGMNANPNATDQPFIGPQLPQPPVDLDPDGDGINTGIDATPNFNQDLDPTDPSNIAPGTYDPDMNSYFRDTLDEAAATREDVDFYEPEESVDDDAPPSEDTPPPANDEDGEIACQICDNGYPMNVAPVDGKCPEGSTPDDGSDPCAGQQEAKDETQEETTEETKEEKDKAPFKPFRAAIKAAEFVNAWSRRRADRKKKRQQSRERTSDYIYGDTATAADNRGQYDVNTGMQKPDKQVYARQGKYGTELNKVQDGGWIPQTQRDKNKKQKSDKKQKDQLSNFNKSQDPFIGYNYDIDYFYANPENRGRHTEDYQNWWDAGDSHGTRVLDAEGNPVNFRKGAHEGHYSGQQYSLKNPMNFSQKDYEALIANMDFNPKYLDWRGQERRQGRSKENPMGNWEYKNIHAEKFNAFQDLLEKSSGFAWDPMQVADAAYTLRRGSTRGGWGSGTNAQQLFAPGLPRPDDYRKDPSIWGDYGDAIYADRIENPGGIPENTTMANVNNIIQANIKPQPTRSETPISLPISRVDSIPTNTNREIIRPSVEEDVFAGMSPREIRKAKRAAMFADAMKPQTMAKYGEEIDLDPETIIELIAAGADIEIL